MEWSGGKKFGEGKYILFQKRRRTKKENEENIWRRKIIFCWGEGKGGKYFEKDIFLRTRRQTKKENEENIFLCGGEEKESRKRRKIYSLRRRIKTKKKRGDNIWRRRIYFCRGEEKWRRKRRKIFGEDLSKIVKDIEKSRFWF